MAWASGRGTIIAGWFEHDTGRRRSRLVVITPAGVALLREALPIWRQTHARLDAALGQPTPN